MSAALRIELCKCLEDALVVFGRDAGSGISDVDVSASGIALDADVDRAVPGVAQGVREEVADDLLELDPIGLEHESVYLVVVEPAGQSLAAGLGLDRGEALFEGWAKGETAGGQAHLAGFEAREVEKLAQELEDIPEGVPDGALAVDDFGVGLIVHMTLEELRRQGDGVERGAQVVGDGGEEEGLLMRGGLGREALVLEVLLERDARGDVASGCDHADDVAVSVAEGGGVDLDGELALAGFPDQIDLANKLAAQRADDRVVVECELSSLQVEDNRVVADVVEDVEAADQRSRGLGMKPLGFGIHADERALGIVGPQGDGHRVEDLAEDLERMLAGAGAEDFHGASVPGGDGLGGGERLDVDPVRFRDLANHAIDGVECAFERLDLAWLAQELAERQSSKPLIETAGGGRL